MLYELRHYYTVSTSDLGAVVRFGGEQLIPGWQAAGITVTGCFTTVLGPSPRFTTLLAFEDANDRQTKLDAFSASKEWQTIEPAFFPNGRALISGCDSALLRPTPYSPDVTTFLNSASSGVFEERIYHGTSQRNHAKINQRFANHTTRIFAQYGLIPVGFWDVEVGMGQPALYYLVRYDSLDGRDALWGSFRDDAEWQRVVAESEKDGPIVRTIEANILAPTSYSPLH